jgi:ComF family protein
MTRNYNRWSASVLAYQVLWRIIDSIYPPHCIGCNETGVNICGSCLVGYKMLDENCCSICGVPLERSSCSCDKLEDKNFILRSWAIYSGVVREAIHRMKFEDDIGLAYFFATKLHERYMDLSWNVDLVVPVPLSRERKKERGYNQASLIARPFAALCNMRYAGKAIKRVRNTASQVNLAADERFNNVKNAFMASADVVYNKKVLLIDDIATTCATISECSNALINAGAEKVFALTLAKTLI